MQGMDDNDTACTGVTAVTSWGYKTVYVKMAQDTAVTAEELRRTGERLNVVAQQYMERVLRPMAQRIDEVLVQPEDEDATPEGMVRLAGRRFIPRDDFKRMQRRAMARDTRRR